MSDINYMTQTRGLPVQWGNEMALSHCTYTTLYTSADLTRQSLPHSDARGRGSPTECDANGGPTVLHPPERSPSRALDVGHAFLRRQLASCESPY
jgi:hypothetical protein